MPADAKLGHAETFEGWFGNVGWLGGCSPPDLLAWQRRVLGQLRSADQGGLMGDTDCRWSCANYSLDIWKAGCTCFANALR